MASISETYVVPWLAEFYHSFPHRDFNFIESTDVFSPDDESYQQSLIMWGILPAAIGTLSFILFAGYYLCCSVYFCSNCSAPAPKSQPAVKKCLRYLMVISAILCSGAVIMGFAANDMTSKGVNQFSSDVQEINSSIQGVRKQITGIDDDVDSTKKALKEFVDLLPLPPITQVAELKNMLDKMKGPLSGIDDKMSVGTSDLTKLIRQILMYNHYRWWSTWGLFCLNTIICVTVVYAAIKKSKCGFILMTLFSIFALLLNWSFVGIELSGSVGAGDLCADPKSAVDEITSNHVQQEVLHYYMECNTQVRNPLQKEFISAETALNSSLKILKNPAFAIFPEAAKKLVNFMKITLDNADSKLSIIENTLQCRHLHKQYVDALDAVCNVVLDGLSLLIIAGLITVFFFGLLLCLVVPIWKYVPRLRPILRKNVYLTTNSYEGPPGEDKHDDTPYHSAVEESVDDSKCEHVPLLKKSPELPPAYESVGQANSDLQFFSLEEDRVRRGKYKGSRSKAGE